MKTFAAAAGWAAAIVYATAAWAAPPPEGAPGGSTGMCKDGTFSSSAERKGACRGHKGVKEWYAQEAAGSSKGETGKTAAAPATAMPTTPTETPHAAAAKTMAAPAAGGNAGQVWANDETKTYHCSGDRWYGKTKHGEYMTESNAKAKGFHASHGKACS